MGSSAGSELMHSGLERAAARLGDRVALRAGERSWSFAELDARRRAVAIVLAGHGVGPGVRVALMATNRMELLVVVTAISTLGGSTVLLNSAWKAAEVRHTTGLTGPALAVADGPSVAVLGDVLGPDRVLDLDGPEIAVARDGTAPPPAAPTTPPAAGAPAVSADDHPGPAAVGPDDEAVLVFSSGTTGMPKAVRHTHASMAAAADQWADALGLGPDDRFQVATPPTHILGLLNLLTALHVGASVRLHPRFDLDEVLRRIETDRVTLEMAVAPIALAMAGHPDLEAFDLSSLRYIMWCATPVTESVARRITERTGVPFVTAYGASELPVISANPIDRPDEWRLDTTGLPATDVEVRIVDLDSGEVAAPGAVGEVQVRSPAVMQGYLPETADAEAFAPDGGPDGGAPWYRTGDVGWLEPDGWVHLTDRSKEMIKVNGFQVAPAEIEAVLYGHPAVVDCAVFGVPDPRAGEVPAAAVQLDPTRPVAAGELEALVADTLATYKNLRHLVVVDAIPRLPSGKVLRRTLRDEWAPTLTSEME